MKTGLVVLAAIVGVILIGNVLMASAQNGSIPTWSMGPGMTLAPALRSGASADVNGDTGIYTGTLPFGGMMAAGGMHEQVMTAIASEIDMTFDELITALQNGQTIAQLAEAKGISLDTLRQAAITAATAALNDLVEQGVITRAQADWMLSHMQNMPMFGLGGGSGNCHGTQPNGAQPGGFGNGMIGGRGMTLAPH